MSKLYPPSDTGTVALEKFDRSATSITSSRTTARDSVGSAPHATVQNRPYSSKRKNQ